MDEELCLPASDFTEIKEGMASILFPRSNAVFYNNVQEFNRDVSIAVIKLFRKLLVSEKTSRFQSKHQVPEENLTSEPRTLSKVDFASESNSSLKAQDDCSMITESSEIPVLDSDLAVDFCILEALSATGLRAVRYALEIPAVTRIVANDISSDAVKNIRRNAKHNEVENIVTVSKADASLLMYQHRFPYSKRFQVIDLDPYGSPCQFFDGAVQAIADGGLLCVTCTDMAGLCGNHGEAAFAKYGGMPLKARYCHEMAIRVVLGSIDSHAGRYKRYIVPLLSLSADFYIRMFMRVFTSASEVKRSASKKSYVFHCSGCETFHLQPVGKSIEVGNSKKYNPATGPVVGPICAECGHVFRIGGPMWSEPICCPDFVNDLKGSIRDERACYGTAERMIGTLSVVSEELSDQPLYYVLDGLCNIVHCNVPPQTAFRSALAHAGYRVSSTHAHKAGLKTDASPQVVWDILRCWIQKHPINKEKIKENSPGAAILAKQPSFQANFERASEVVPASKIQKLNRFPVNPPEWGPKARAKTSGSTETLAEKRRQLQGRKRRKGQPLPSDKLPFACKRFKRGECTNGDACKYIHQLDDGTGDGETAHNDCKTELSSNVLAHAVQLEPKSLDMQEAAVISISVVEEEK